MAIKQSFVAFFSFSFFLSGLGVRQPSWDVEGGAQEKKFGNRCTRATSELPAIFFRTTAKQQ